VPSASTSGDELRLGFGQRGEKRGRDRPWFLQDGEESGVSKREWVVSRYGSL
jgi:hypothetical protein